MKRTFESESLTVDWISFQFELLTDLERKEIAKYFLELGFNSSQEYGKFAKPRKEFMFVRTTNRFQILFTIEAPYWSGTLLHFSGENAQHFYELVKSSQINWEILSSGRLSRLDLYYNRLFQKKDSISVHDFFVACCDDFQSKRRKIVLEQNSEGEILKIGHRKSQNKVRIYPKQNCLRFEYEMMGSKRFLQDSYDFLVSHQLEEFEDQLSNQYLP